jgi:hypothetical protein
MHRSTADLSGFGTYFILIPTGRLQDSPSRNNFKIIKMVVLMYEIIKTVVLLLF